MNGALDILKRERDDSAEQIRVLRARIKDLDSAIGILEGQPVSTGNRRSSGDLKGRVLSKLEELGNTGGTPRELAESLTHDGRQTSDASVSSTLSRLKGESKVANRNGRWFVANPSANRADAVTEGWDIPPNTPPEWGEIDDEPPF